MRLSRAESRWGWLIILLSSLALAIVEKAHLVLPRPGMRGLSFLLEQIRHAFPPPPFFLFPIMFGLLLLSPLW